MPYVALGIHYLAKLSSLVVVVLYEPVGESCICGLYQIPLEV